VLRVGYDRRGNGFVDNGSSIFDFAEILQETGLKMQMLGVSP
jgi:hypothetical protein